MTKMKLVPAEPTDEMEAASDSYADRNITDSFYDCWSDAYGYDIYEAMVTAAPKGGKVSREVVEEAAKQLCLKEGYDPNMPVRQIGQTEGRPLWRLYISSVSLVASVFGLEVEE